MDTLGGGQLGHMSNVPYFFLYSFHVNSKMVPCGMSNKKKKPMYVILVYIELLWGYIAYNKVHVI